MTPEIAIKAALKAGLTFELPPTKLLLFAHMIAAVEREECARVCEELAELNRQSADEFMWQWKECAEAIRSRT